MKNKKITLLVSALSLTLILAIGLGVWGYQSNKKLREEKNSVSSLESQLAASKDLANQQTSSNPTTTPSTNTETMASCSTSSEVCIKEWGIKLKFADADKVTYSVDSTPGVLATGENYQASANLVFKSGTVSEDCKEIGIKLVQSSSKPEGTSQMIGSYYYFFRGGPGPCNNDSDNQLKTAIASQQLGTAGGYTIEPYNP